MKVFRTTEEIKKAITVDVLRVDGDVHFLCDFAINASLDISGDIKALNIDAGDIKALNIDAGDINFYAVNKRRMQ